jgi:hypothetical protein
MSIITLDGTKYEVSPPDIDKNGVTGGIEHVSRAMENTTNINQPTELGEALKDLDYDDLDPVTRMSGIDMRSRLQIFEINSLWCIDALVAMKFLPSSCLTITRQRKRLLVSLSGLGRTEKVQMTVGQREQQAKAANGGMMDKMKGFFGGGQ